MDWSLASGTVLKRRFLLVENGFTVTGPVCIFCVVQIQKRHSSSSMDERPSPSPSAREYVESLHQNNRVTLLFGKNNVLVQPVTIWLLFITHRYTDMTLPKNNLTSILVAVSEGWHGGYPRVPLSAPERRHHDPEVDTQPAHERLCWRLGLRTQVQKLSSCKWIVIMVNVSESPLMIIWVILLVLRISNL